MFGSVRCKMCVKPVYRMDPLINLDGAIIHKQCAKCGDCNCQITLSNFVKNEIGDQTSLICKIHYMKRFNEGVGYPGEEKYKMKSAQSNGGSAVQSTKEVESESFPSRKNLKPVSKPLASTSESSVLTSDSVVTTSASTSVSAGDSSSSRRIESSTSGTAEMSTDQSDSDTCAINLEQKKVVIGEEDENQASSETTSESTDDSCLSTAQVSPISDATRVPSVPSFKSHPVAQVEVIPEPTAAPASKTPGAEPGTVQNFRRLFSGSSKVTAPPPPPSRSRFSVTRKEVSFPEGQPSDTSNFERPKSWRSSKVSSQLSSSQSGESYVGGTKSVLARYAHNISERSSVKISAPVQRASWTKQLVNQE